MIELSNCPLCEIDFPTDDIVILQEHFVTAHSVDGVIGEQQKS
jgi:hypothetical protein